MKIPEAVYRLQFSPSFDFERANDILDYLADLGISDIYASPIFKACAGSPHGYDVVDPTEVNPELGGEEALLTLISNAKKLDLGWVQDIVPNHMAINSQNRWLMDVIENGSGSRYYDHFDINWDHYYESINGRLLAPFLGSFYGEAIDRGEITLHIGPEGLSVKYYDVVFPLRLESYRKVLGPDLEEMKRFLEPNHPDLVGFIGAVEILDNLPPSHRVDERYRQISFGKRELWRIYRDSDPIKRYVDARLESFNGTPEKPDSFDLLDNLLAEQHFRLSFWKVATEEINYRRFFTINSLICMKLEDENVFDHTHELIKKLTDDKLFTGLRVDHLDGLYDPSRYLDHLRNITADSYIIVEKILETGEALPSDWRIQGTTGYDILNVINGLFIKGENKNEFHHIYARLIKQQEAYPKLVAEKKRLIAERHLAGDIENLAHTMKRISARDRHGNDIALPGLRRALIELMAWFPVYRTYIDAIGVDEIDRTHINEAYEKALVHSPGLAYELKFIRKFLLLHFRENADESEKAEILRFVMRFQQLTGPLMAKGFEDTALYIYNLFTSMNEVGGDPQKFGFDPGEFHEFCRSRAESAPAALNTLSTHDAKRGEDVRARINVLSEIPDRWDQELKLWMKINRNTRTRSLGKPLPDRNDEYLLYQTLIGTYPLDDESPEKYLNRIKEYVIKAVREAKVHTAWLKPDDEYENAFLKFVEKVLSPGDKNDFLEAFLPLQKKVAHYGIYNSLSQTLLKMTAPGIPDFYQGTELWDLNLVDPDNRRPVDYEKRRNLLDKIKSRETQDLPGLLNDLNDHPEDGRIKMYLIRRILKSRRENADLYLKGEYIPLEISGEFAELVVAFARKLGNKWAVTAIPRFLTSLISENDAPLGNDIWHSTEIILPENSPEQWINVLTDDKLSGRGTLKTGDTFSRFPVALLIGESHA